MSSRKGLTKATERYKKLIHAATCAKSFGLGDFSAFKPPKQLFAYFGMDPNVNGFGKFKGTEVHMSKRGSRIAHRAIFAIALARTLK